MTALEDLCERTAENVERFWQASNGADFGPLIEFTPADGSGSTIALLAGFDPRNSTHRVGFREVVRQLSMKMDAFAVAFFVEGWEGLGVGWEADQEKQETMIVMIDSRAGRKMIVWPIIERKLGARKVFNSGFAGWFAELLDPALRWH